MKIIRQLAQWMLDEGRIDPVHYKAILWAIDNGTPIIDEEKAILDECAEEEAREAAFEAADELSGADEKREAWWDLFSGHAISREGKAAHGGGRKATADKTPVKVQKLDQGLPAMLLPPGADPGAFPLAALLLAVDEARGNRRAKDWAGFVEAAAALYTTGAEELHDALWVAMRKRGRELGRFFATAERGDPLFPEGFLSGLSGESVAALEKIIIGTDTEFSFKKNDWILKYSSFNALNEACIVRNRLRRIYRLWVRHFAYWDSFGAADNGMPCMAMSFGKTTLKVPADIWLYLRHGPGTRFLPEEKILAVDELPCHDAGDRVSDFDKRPINLMVDAQLVMVRNLATETCRITQRSDTNSSLPFIEATASGNVMLCRPDSAGSGKNAHSIAPPDDMERLLWGSDQWWDNFWRHPVVVFSCQESFPWDILDGEQWALILCKWPKNALQFVKYCDWTKLDGFDWCELLAERPQFAQYCDWDKLNELHQDCHWNDLICEQPQLARYRDWSKIRGHLLARTLVDYPQFAEYCDLSTLDGEDWRQLLGHHPGFADDSDWSKLDGEDWRCLLIQHPQFAKYCDWSKLDSQDWRCLLVNQPQFASNCDFSGFSGSDWAELLSEQPQIAGLCDWTKLTSADWDILLDKQPQLSFFRSAEKPK